MLGEASQVGKSLVVIVAGPFLQAHIEAFEIGQIALRPDA
jgi:hypothetical protein